MAEPETPARAATAAGVVARRAASAGGVLLAGATRVVAALRPSAKPLHPEGVILTGRIHRHGSEPATGVAWLDEQGEDDVLVRQSRAVGLPAVLPDIHGLAIRIPAIGDGADLLLASTGWGSFGRFVLTASREPSRRPLTTLLPYRTARGPLLIGARAMGPQSYTLSWARGGGDWRTFGVLILSGRQAEGQEVSFDPVLHRLPGLEQYPAVVRLREPAYRRARAASDRQSTDTGDR